MHNDNLPQKILLAEDYGANVLVAGTLLELLGYEYDVASNGEEAVQKVLENRPHYMMVLMDVQMPVLDGYAATGRIRAEEKRLNISRLPIIGVTAHALAGDRQKCLVAGMDDYLAKPFLKEELEQKISLALQFRHMASA